MTIGADIRKYIEVPFRLNYPCHLQTLYGAFSHKVSYTYSNKVWDVIFSLPQSPFLFYKKVLKEGWKISWFVGLCV